MLTYLLVGLGVLILGFVVVVLMQPTDFRITRSAIIAAPPAVVFAQVNDFHKWEAWSPWAKMDPTAKNSFEGPASGEGSVFRWVGNSQVGEGNMTITESRPAEFLRIRLEFIKPFAGVNTTEFTFQPEGGRTNVTWTMFGKNGFMGKAVGMVINCEKMVGGQFATGLENIRAICEGGAAVPTEVTSR